MRTAAHNPSCIFRDAHLLNNVERSKLELSDPTLETAANLRLFLKLITTGEVDDDKTCCNILSIKHPQKAESSPYYTSQPQTWCQLLPVQLSPCDLSFDLWLSIPSEYIFALTHAFNDHIKGGKSNTFHMSVPFRKHLDSVKQARRHHM